MATNIIIRWRSYGADGDVGIIDTIKDITADKPDNVFVGGVEFVEKAWPLKKVLALIQTLSIIYFVLRFSSNVEIEEDAMYKVTAINGVLKTKRIVE